VTPVSQLHTEQLEFIGGVAGKLNEFLAVQQDMMATISPDVAPLMGSISNLVTGGKRLRALMCYWGWRGAGGPAGDADILTAGCALELFQAAALIHDDIIDRSDTRRGGPSVHRRFSQLHEANGWALDNERFGHAAAILTGDITTAIDDSFWFGKKNAVTRMTASGALTEYELPNPMSRPRRLTITPDDVVYYADYSRGYLGMYNPKTKASKEWPSPSGPKSQPYGIVYTNGAVWYNESAIRPNTIVRFDPKTEKFQSWIIPAGGGVVRNMSVMPNGNISMAESGEPRRARRNQRKEQRNELAGRLHRDRRCRAGFLDRRAHRFPPPPCQPRSRVLDIHVIDRRDVERQQLRHDESTNHSQTKRTARFGAGA